MKYRPIFSSILFLSVISIAFAKHQQPAGYVVQQEKNIQRSESGPHDGGGSTIAAPFFENIPDFKFAFRKRTLHSGSTIGYHLQKVDEVYYILSGSGEMTMNGNKFTVAVGDAILTRGGSSHGLKPIGEKDLALLIVYQK
ncbi:MAG TPA: cupin domain-containing protein [Chitinophagaceae bacterium]|nr:cupin domain-containing protein [Chitinophagaceae bacterium]